MKDRKIELSSIPKGDFGKELCKIVIEATICENGLALSIVPPDLPYKLAEGLGEAVTKVLVDWNEKAKREMKGVGDDNSRNL